MQLGHKQAVVADHLQVVCGEKDDGGDGDDGDYVIGDDVDGNDDDDDDDNNGHRCHTDASPEAAPKTCHPLQLLLHSLFVCTNKIFLSRCTHIFQVAARLLI